jgi:hypothetical protein
MMKYILAFVVLMHGLIHFMGFAKAFHYGDMKQLTIPISKPVGLLWITTAFLFIITAALFLLKKEYWWVIAAAAVILSQIVISIGWKDARFGTIANIIILLAVIAGWGSSRFENSWRKDVSKHLEQTNRFTTELLLKADLQHLPQPVQRYLEYAGVLNKPKVKNMHVVFSGEMRDTGKDYFQFTSAQYNFFDVPARLFYMKGKMFGIIVPGYHRYMHATAIMNIRLFGLYPIVKKEGEVINKAETVTLLNDMCLLAPATLIDRRIRWEPVDSLSAKAIFTNTGITVSAVLYFNEQGQLIDFISNDRTAVADMRQYPWSTPVSDYKNINGLNIMSYGESIWHYPDGAFTYGKFHLEKIEYNVKGLK